MKKMMLFVALALFATLTVFAQESKSIDIPRRNTERLKGFQLPDSLAHMSPWNPEYRDKTAVREKPAVSMTSVVVIPGESLPDRVTVLNNNTLRLGRHFNLSNGQAWNWSPFPDAYLDARTLSFPMPR